MWKQELENEILERCNAILLADPLSSDASSFLDTLQSLAILAQEFDLNPKLHQRVLSCIEQLHLNAKPNEIALAEFQKIEERVKNWDRRYSGSLRTTKLIAGLTSQLSAIGQVIKKNSQNISIPSTDSLHKIN